MAEMRWAVVPACLTFGPLFLIMGIAGDAWLLLGGAMMTTAGSGILLHGIFTRQLPRSSLTRDSLSDIVFGVGLGCLTVAGFLDDLSIESLTYVGIAIILLGSFLKPRLDKRAESSQGAA